MEDNIKNANQPIACIHCKKQNLIFLPETVSAKDTSSLLTTIFITSLIGFFICAILIIWCISEVPLPKEILAGVATPEVVLKNLSEMLFLKICNSILIFFFIASITTAILKRFLPYRIYTKTKIICKDCGQTYYLD